MVDGLGVGDIGQVVLRDRQLLAKDGMFTIIVIIDSKTKKLVGKPQVTSRGFIFVKENFNFIAVFLIYQSLHEPSLCPNIRSEFLLWKA